VSEPTPESIYLRGHPGLRDRVVAMDGFGRWMAGFAPVAVDGDTYWVRRRTGADDFGDDRLKDLDQMVLAWLQSCRPDLLPENPP